jgi:putative flippase GtrA
MALIKWLWRQRLIRFGVVGAVCTGLQETVLLTLVHAHYNARLANAIGIIVAAQLSFFLSRRLIWRDRYINNHAVAWTSFMAIAITAFVASESTFTLTQYLGFRNVAASLTGVVVGTAVTWFGNNKGTFRKKQRPNRVTEEMERYVSDVDLSIIIPALREAQHIGSTLRRLAACLGWCDLGTVEVIVVAADGGDNTAAIAAGYADLFPHFQVLQPGPAVGKGRDVQAGMSQARGRFRMFMDADLATPLWHMQHVKRFMEADGHVGIGVRRVGRYHHTKTRNFVSFCCSMLTFLVAIPGIRDARCGFKIFEARVAEQLFSRLRLLQWGFDTELLAMARLFGHEITTFKISDWHDPRESGDGLRGEACSLFKVIYGNVLDPFIIRWNVLTGKYTRAVHNHPPHTHRKVRQRAVNEIVTARERDRTVRWVALVSFVTAITSYIIVAQHHELLRFSDAASYMLIARRTVMGLTPGLAQLGASWLPLPDMLQFPFIWDSYFYRTGLAGSISSMAAFVLSCSLLYLIVYRYTGRKIAGIVAAATFGLSFNVLYLQSTPMTEMLMFASILAAVYCLQQWIDTDRYRWLTASGVAAFAASLIRYEAWPIVGLLVIVAGIAAFRQHGDDLDTQLRRRRARDRVVLTLLFGLAGIGMWLLYNQIIFHSWSSFLNGAYAHPAIGGGDPARHNWRNTTLTYWDAMVNTVGLPVLISGAVGMVVFGVNEFIRKRVVIRALPIMTLLAVIPFYLLTIYSGQRPLDVSQINGYNYNVRYGLLVLLPCAIFIGYLVGVVANRRLLLYPSLAAIVTIVFGYGAISVQQGIAPLVGIEHATPASMQAANAYERLIHGDGRVLMQFWGNEAVAFEAVPVNQIVWEGSNGLWTSALRSPIHNDISVIIARCAQPLPDLVCTSVNKGEISHYREVWSNKVYTIYVARTQPTINATLATRR